MSEPAKLLDPAVLGQVRGVLILLAGMGLGGTWLKYLVGLDDASFNALATTIVTVGGGLLYLGPAIWGWLEAKWLARQSRSLQVAAATTSVALGVPVTVTVTPPGEDNKATMISIAEQTKSPLVPTDVAPSPAPLVV